MNGKRISPKKIKVNIKLRTEIFYSGTLGGCRIKFIRGKMRVPRVLLFSRLQALLAEVCNANPLKRQIE